MRAAERAERGDAIPPRTSRADLVTWAKGHLADRKLIVVSNREPYSHIVDGDRVRWMRNAGGLTVALDAVMQAVGGTWIAHGGADADRVTVDERDHVACPPNDPRYTLRRLWLDHAEFQRYYSGFANSALWPLCHVVYVRPRFRLDDWQAYERVNRRFADLVLEEVGSAPALVFLQDYHLALAARFIKERRPDLLVAQFWHIPWPNPEVFRVLPWGAELLDGLLANDVLGFHIRRDALNFLEAVSATVEARIDTGQLAVDRAGRRTWLRHFPISVDADGLAALVDTPDARDAERRLRRELGLGGLKVMLGVDRLDYTKGIPERLLAFERLFQLHPEWRGRLCFIQIGVPSRIELPEYRAVRERMVRLADRINRRYPRPGGPTVHVVEQNLDFRELIPYYRLADLCAVTSLHDGLNLVAKEYVAASTDLEGSLVLSPFTGAARELERAWLASPYDREALAEAYHQALSEEPHARRARMSALRETVLRRNVFDWTIEVLDTVLGLHLHDPAAPPADVART
jgi:trehalose 6-phosphate synthase